MPRIYDSTNDPLDFCLSCWSQFAATEEAAAKRFQGHGTGPDGRGDCFAYDAEHPDYGGEDYTCTTCSRPLTDADNDDRELVAARIRVAAIHAAQTGQSTP